VQMNWKTETTLVSKPGSLVTSAMGDWAQTSRLEFLEQFPVQHCEVSLVQSGQNGFLSLKINLVEAHFSEQEEVCIGKLKNDRLILPRSKEYFMAHFSTTSEFETEHNNQANVKESAGKNEALGALPKTNDGLLQDAAKKIDTAPIPPKPQPQLDSDGGAPKQPEQQEPRQEKYLRGRPEPEIVPPLEEPEEGGLL